MNKPCPKCQSTNTGTTNRARRTGGFLGLVAGALIDTTSSTAKPPVGTPLAILAKSPIGFAVTVASLSVLGAISGLSAGSAIGAHVDKTVLNNHLCHDCGHRFGDNHE